MPMKSAPDQPIAPHGPRIRMPFTDLAVICTLLDLVRKGT